LAYDPLGEAMFVSSLNDGTSDQQPIILRVPNEKPSLGVAWDNQIQAQKPGQVEMKSKEHEAVSVSGAGDAQSSSLSGDIDHKHASIKVRASELVEPPFHPRGHPHYLKP
jgi:hypothetical protein